MICNHYTPEFVTARMRERESGHEPPCPHCLLNRAELLLQEVYEDWLRYEPMANDIRIRIDALLHAEDVRSGE